MKISQLFSAKRPVVSFEFFPPKTEEGFANLMAAVEQLKDLDPAFVSITYGAGGSTRERTLELVTRIKNDIGIEAAAHLTCVGHSREELDGILSALKAAGIENILALRGDPPKGQTEFKAAPDGFSYASQLVRFIRQKHDFCLGVAGYPEKHIESPSMEDDLQHLTEKVEAGADFVVTQLFFDNADYFSYVKRVRDLGIDKPIVAGIMPITDVDQIKRFTTMCGAVLPQALLARLERVKGDKERVIEIGIEHAIAQCEELLQRGAPGIHFYTLNKSQSTRAIFSRLRSAQLV